MHSTDGRGRKQFSDPATLRYHKLKLALSSDFVYIGSSGYLLPYSDVTWLYKRVQKSYGVPVTTHLMAGLVNGKSICLAARRVNDAFIVEVAQKVLSRNPDCLIATLSTMRRSIASACGNLRRPAQNSPRFKD
jgi:hypothetical protein